ncbi:hypothetical protein VCRA2119O48_450006 [Vibrio crassostreae]|nr:hypothetical protein VCRA2119O48_450006 [Vibrio crassostreae]CAK3978950.1 hypothetical protein VCRA212O16_520014 [Vibrio crassostreae]
MWFMFYVIDFECGSFRVNGAGGESCIDALVAKWLCCYHGQGI